MTQSVYNFQLPSNASSQLDFTAFITTLNFFHPLNTEEADYLLKIAKPVSFKKGELLLKSGEICNHLYFIKKGIVRGYVKEGKKDITTWITAENEMVTSISGLGNSNVSEENMQAVENCSAWAITNRDLEDLYSKFPVFNIVARKLLQKYYKDAEGRAFIARLSKAETKYLYFLKNHGHLANRVPLKYIASFLGITLETLSRVRKKISSAI